MLTHTYPHKPQKKIKVTICNHQADSPLYVWPDVWSGDLQVLKKYGHTWHRMSLLRPGVIKQHKPNQTKPKYYKPNFSKVSPTCRLINIKERFWQGNPLKESHKTSICKWSKSLENATAILNWFNSITDIHSSFICFDKLLISTPQSLKNYIAVKFQSINSTSQS